MLRDHQRCVVAWERAVAPDRQVTLNKTLDTTLLLSSHYPDPLSLIQPDDPIPIPSAQLTSLTRNLPLSYLNPRAASLWLLDSQCLAMVCVPSFPATQPANNFLLVCLFSYLHFPAPSHTGGSRPIFWLIPPRPRSGLLCQQSLILPEILTHVFVNISVT